MRPDCSVTGSTSALLRNCGVVDSEGSRDQQRQMGGLRAGRAAMEMELMMLGST